MNYRTPNYFADFQCLGGDCEDTCCQQWDIKLDRQHYLKLREVMQGSEEEQRLFAQYVVLNDSPVTGEHDHAFIRMADNGYCPMLDSEGLCDIHHRHGVEPLGNVCMFFPRVISRCDGDIEMSGALSCPEVVRRCVLSEQPVRYVRFGIASLPRPHGYPIHRDLPTAEEDHYARHFKVVRKAFLQLMQPGAHSLETRLFALASLSNRLSAFYHTGCAAIPSGLLETSLENGLAAATLEKIRDYLDAYDGRDAIGLLVVRSILQIKQTEFPHEHIASLAGDILTGPVADIAALQSRFVRQRQACETAFGSRIDDSLLRYAENCLYREWFYTMPDTFTYVQMLLIRLAMLQFLLYSHPGLQTLIADPDMAMEQRQQALDRIIVQVIYRFAREIDQNMAFLQVIYNALSEQQMMNADYSLAFIRLADRERPVTSDE